MSTMPIRILALTICATGLLFGQAAEFSFSAGANRLSGSNLGSGYRLDGGFRFGFRVTVNNWRFFGHEFGYAYNRMQLKFGSADAGGMAGHQGLYHFLAYATPEGSRIRPFVAGGGHFTNFVPPGASAAYGQGQNKFGVNYGAGIKTKVSDKFLIRFDVKQYLQGKPFTNATGGSGSLRINEISAGFALYL